jgi:acyl-CoA thioester hydrolase
MESAILDLPLLLYDQTVSVGTCQTTPPRQRGPLAGAGAGVQRIGTQLYQKRVEAMSDLENQESKIENPLSLLAGFPVVVQLPVVWGEMDSYRHVNNVVYFRYFESARLEYFRRLDWFVYEQQTGIGPILAATQARFRKALSYPDTVWVGARISEISDDRFTMEYLLVSQRFGAIATEGQGKVVAFNYREGKKVPIPEELRRRIANLEAGLLPV